MIAFALWATLLAADLQASSLAMTSAPDPNQKPECPKPTYAHVAYGRDPLQYLDFWRAKSNRPNGLVFFVHGGSWINGTPKQVFTMGGLNRFLDAGISVATIEYRKLKEAQNAGVNPPCKWPLSDAARALQFLRSRAPEWGFDKKRIAGSGVSAGACTVLWLALHDDMSNPSSSDQVERESTRLITVGVLDPQTSLDPLETRQWIPNATYGNGAFGFPNFESWYQARESLLPLIQQYSPMALVSPDDPPVFCAFAEKVLKPAGQIQHNATHSPVFGLKLKEKMDAVHVECGLSVHGKPISGSYANQIDYLISKLADGDFHAKGS